MTGLLARPADAEALPAPLFTILPPSFIDIFTGRASFPRSSLLCCDQKDRTDRISEEEFLMTTLAHPQTTKGAPKGQSSPASEDWLDCCPTTAFAG